MHINPVDRVILGVFEYNLIILFVQKVEHQIGFLIEKHALGEKGATRRAKRIKGKLQGAFQHFFPDCQLYEFGSCANGLGTIDSDVDLCLDVGCCWQADSDAVSDLLLLI